MDQKTTLNANWIPELLRALAKQIEDDPDYPLPVDERVMTVAEFIADPAGASEWMGYLVNELDVNAIMYPNLGPPSVRESKPRGAKRRSAKRQAVPA